MSAPDDVPRHRPRAAAAFLIVIVVGALGVFGGVAVFLNTGGKGAGGQRGSPNPEGSGVQVVSLNQTARDGPLAFTVTSFDCIGDALATGSAQATASAGGRFCVADVTVRNESGATQRFRDAPQILVDSAGARHTPHAEAVAALNPAGEGAYDDIRPGKEVLVSLPWDVPVGAAPVALELHSEPSSRGVTVNFPYTGATGSPGPADPPPSPTLTPSPTPTPTPTADPVAALPPGLYCRDLYPKGVSYPDALRYWEREGRPERMDADGNGVPCETVYPADARG